MLLAVNYAKIYEPLESWHLLRQLLLPSGLLDDGAATLLANMLLQQLLDQSQQINDWM